MSGLKAKFKQPLGDEKETRPIKYPLDCLFISNTKEGEGDPFIYYKNPVKKLNELSTLIAIPKKILVIKALPQAAIEFTVVVNVRVLSPVLAQEVERV